ncbi:MAG: hypothetical protein FWG09_01635 [Synergistaceae bacterium]|nr:hypothetical protein [Synergistaceae bacterium]
MRQTISKNKKLWIAKIMKAKRRVGHKGRGRPTPQKSAADEETKRLVRLGKLVGSLLVEKTV